MSDAVLQAKIKAFDEFTSVFNRYQQELRNVDRAEREAAQGAEQANKSTGDFFKTVAELGALYAFQRALKEVIVSGREFELTIKQAQAVTGDFSATLRNLAMATRGGNLDAFGPTQLAEAYRELGAAGATTQEIMAATPDILEFGSAALLNMEQSAYGVLAAAKSFNIALTDSGQIVDAYTEAMNLGALAGEDFSKIMGSAGAVAKLAGQDFREILSVGSALRDAGVSADEAGTAIKSALMQIINPSKEASELMKQLGINIYDASGNMKQWSDITAEFEKALGPYNEQSKQLILSTVFGSYGIRAMATSLNNGSDYLKAFTDGLKNAEGATHEMAEAMSDTYDGAARQFNASLERTKILLFEDVAPAAGAVLGALNTLLLGVQSLDDGTRHFIEILVGSAGLVMALAAVTTAVRTLLPILAAFGISTAALAGPIGIIIAAIGVATTAFISYKGAVAQAELEEANHIKTLEGQIKTIPNLVKQHDDLSKKTKRTTEEEAALKQVTEELADILPEAIRGFDSFGQAILDTGNLADLAKGKIASLKDEVIGYYKLRADMAREELPGIKKQYAEVEKELKPLQEQLKIAQSGKYDIKIAGTTIPMGWAWGKDLGDPDTIKGKIKAVRTEQEKLYSDRLQYERDLAIYESIKKGTYWDKPTGGTDTKTPAGTKTWTPDTGGSKGSKNIAADAAKALTEAIDTALLPYRNAVEMAGIAVSSLTSKEQFLTQIISSGNGTLADTIELNKTRVEQLVRLSDQQDALRQQTEAEKVALVNLQEKLQAANDPEAVKELQSEILNLQKSIAQAGQAWMQAEQQKIMMLNRVKEEEKRRYDDAYSKAMDLMRHQVGMAAMSTEQQIAYMEKLRDAHAWTQQQMWEFEESLYRLRRQQLSDMLDRVEDEYNNRLDVIDARTKAITRSIQSQIDALNKKSEDNSRADAEIRYNQKIKELIEKRQYHELRTGKDHTQAILDIDKELAEEKRQWELQQQEWAIEDQKSNLQKQLDQAKEEGDRERKQAEEHYRKAKRIAESGVMDIIAALAATEPKWMETGKQLIDALISGMKSGDFSSVQRLVDSVRNQAPKTVTEPDFPSPSGGGGGGSSGGSSKKSPLWTIPPGAYRRYGDTTAMWSQDLARLLGVSVSWDQASGRVIIGGKPFNPLENDNGRTYVSIRQVSEAMGYRVEWNDPDVEIYKAAKGGIFTKPALSMMAEAGGSEVALPLDRLQPMINVAMLEAMRRNEPINDNAIDRAASRVIAAIERLTGIQFTGPLVKIEHCEFADRYDGESLGIDVRNILAARG